MKTMMEVTSKHFFSYVSFVATSGIRSFVFDSSGEVRGEIRI